jgi:hypothetical protein
VTHCNVFTNSSASNRAFEEVIGLLRALQRFLEEVSPGERKRLVSRLEFYGAAPIGRATMLDLIENLPDPADYVNQDDDAY